MISFASSTVIERPAGEIFDFVAHPEKHVNWQHGLIEVDSQGQTGVGTKLREVRKFMGRRLEFEGYIVEFEKDKAYRVKEESPQFSIDQRTTLEPVKGGTRLTVEIEIDTRGTFKAAKAIAERMIKREVEANLATLKDVLEAHRDLHEAVSRLGPPQHR